MQSKILELFIMKTLEYFVMGVFFATFMFFTTVFSNHDGVLGRVLPPSFDHVINYLNTPSTIFFFIALAFNCTFPEFKKGFLNRFLGIFFTSIFDAFLYILYIVLSFSWSNWLLGYNFFTISISYFVFGAFHVVFVELLPLEKSEDFTGLYPVSLIILLFLFLI